MQGCVPPPRVEANHNTSRNVASIVKVLEADVAVVLYIFDVDPHMQMSSSTLH